MHTYLCDFIVVIVTHRRSHSQPCNHQQLYIQLLTTHMDDGHRDTIYIPIAHTAKQFEMGRRATENSRRPRVALQI